MLIQFSTNGQAANTRIAMRSTTNEPRCVKISARFCVSRPKYEQKDLSRLLFNTKHQPNLDSSLYLSSFLSPWIDGAPKSHKIPSPENAAARRGDSLRGGPWRQLCILRRSEGFKKPQLSSTLSSTSGRPQKAYTLYVLTSKNVGVQRPSLKLGNSARIYSKPLEIASLAADTGTLLFPRLLTGRQINGGRERTLQLRYSVYRTGFPLVD